MRTGPRRGFVIAILVIGLGVAAAPAIFQLFTRAPGGGRMIDSFQPIMTQAKVNAFRSYMAEIGRGEAEAAGPVTAAVAQKVGQPVGAVNQRYGSLATFEKQWPGIDSDMGSMLSTMQKDLPDYQAVKALPPFWMFPWFFVLPGLIIAAVAASVLRRSRRGRTTRRSVIALGVLGVALVAAPAVFQMFTRAPRGAQMISDFKPLMTPTKVTTVQGYFLTIGAAEGQLRTEVLPLLSSGTSGSSASPASSASSASSATVAPSTAASFPAVAQWSRDWPHISDEMAPMIGAMSDNVSNFQGIAALPPFWMFPWFFVLPGLLVLGLAIGARERLEAEAAPAVVDLTSTAPAQAVTVGPRNGSPA